MIVVVDIRTPNRYALRIDLIFKKKISTVRLSRSEMLWISGQFRGILRLMVTVIVSIYNSKHSSPQCKMIFF